MSEKEGKIDEIIETLSPIERSIVPFLKEKTVKEIVEKSKMDETSVKRALSFLANKNAIELEIKETRQIILGDNGVLYLKNELPERRLINTLLKHKHLELKEAREKSGLSENEFAIALGVLKKKALINVLENKIMLSATPEEVEKKTLEEKFLSLLPLDFEKLKDEEKLVFEQLKSRKDVVRVEETKEMQFELTAVGKELLKNSGKLEQAAGLVEQLTPEMLEKNLWKGKSFRRYDITSKVPKIYGGKRQKYYEFLQEIRQKLSALGFEEMTGPSVVSEFWNFDALFQPQFHVAREWSATYFVKNKLKSEIPKELAEKVRKVHEEKWKTSWDIEKAKNLILRPQCTAVSAQTLPHAKIPGKYFAISRVYRPDVIDAKHLIEFDQAEGIILDENLNFSNLLGMLKLFATDIMGIKEVRFKPDYFPFTEPSAVMYVKHPKFGWIEVGGAGIFRKEVSETLTGKNVPVLAWGLGITRLAMIKLGIDDIRELFSYNIGFLRRK